MLHSLENTESEWLAQYAAMRQALADLRVEQPVGEGRGYGHDIVLEDADFTGSSGLDDIWNMLGNDAQDAENSSNVSDSVTNSPTGRPELDGPHGQKWLESKCLTFASSNPGLNAEELQQRLSAILVSDMRGLSVGFLLLPEID